MGSPHTQLKAQTRFKARTRLKARTLAFALACVGALLSACAGRELPLSHGSDEPEPPQTQYGLKLPPPSLIGDTEEGLAVLTTAPSLKEARAAVERFFRAIVEESVQRLSDELAPGRSRETVSRWQRRFASLDYSALQGVTLFREGDVSTTRGGEATPGGTIAPGSSDAVVVVVRPRVTTVGSTRLFGDELVFFLQRDADRYLITAIHEDFPLL